MSRKPSAETELKTVKRQLRDSELLCHQWKSDATFHKNRATKAEEECADWKRRFDLLLARTPINPETKP